jgi:hypothetical protein
MPRKFGLLACVALAIVASFAAVSYARGTSKSKSQAGFPHGLPVGNLHPISLSPAEQANLTQLIGSIGSQEAGITNDSFAEVRAFHGPSGELMYVIPGTSGVCLVMANASTCGDPLSSHAIGLEEINHENGNLSGAGITDGSASQVVVKLNGSSVTLPVSNGTYVIGAGAGLHVPKAQRNLPPISFTTR